MRDAQTANPALSDRELARDAARNLAGTPETHVERIRKRYGRLRREGKLLNPIERDVATLRSMAVHHRARISERLAEREAELRLAEKAAAEVGLSIDTSEILETIEALATEIRVLEDTAGLPDMAFNVFLSLGVFEPDEMAEQYRIATTRMRTLKHQRDLLLEVHKLRLAVATLSRARSPRS